MLTDVLAKLQDCRKCGRATIVRTLCADLALLRQPCNKTQLHSTVIARQSCGICGRNAWVLPLALILRTPCVSYSSLAAALRVLWQSCVLVRSQESRKENEHVKNLVFVVATAMRCVRQSCGAAHNAIGLPHETQKGVVVDRCTAAVRLMRNRLRIECNSDHKKCDKRFAYKCLQGNRSWKNDYESLMPENVVSRKILTKMVAIFRFLVFFAFINHPYVNIPCTKKYSEKCA